MKNIYIYIILLLTFSSLNAQWIDWKNTWFRYNNNQVNSAITYDTSAVQLFTRMTTQPSNARKTLINNLIINAKTHGWWQRGDVMYMLPNFDTSCVKLNWIKDAHNITNSNGRWGIDTGWTGNGTNSVLNTHYNITTNRVHFTADTGSIIFYSNSITASNNTSNFGAYKVFRVYDYWYTNYSISFGDGEASLFSTKPKTYGLTAIVQSDSTRLFNFSQDDTIIGSRVRDYAASPNNVMGIGAVLNDSTPSFSSERTYQFFFMGGVLTQEQVAYMYADVMEYLNGIGTLFSAINVVCAGNSLTYGTSSTNDSDYVNILSGMLGSNYTVYNKGVWGETDSGLFARYTSEVKPLIHPYKTNWLIYWEGTNSFCHDSSVDTVYARQKQYCDLARADGFDKIIVNTVMNGAGTITGFDDLRLALNVQLRSNDFADYVCDIGADSILGCTGCNANFEYFNFADALHLINKGYNRVALLLRTIII